MSRRHAALVSFGILLSRLSGLLRMKVLAYALGQGDEADAWAAGVRIPNMLQNLFGEGVLSAAFIPRYARLLAEGKEEDAKRLAGALLSILALLLAVMVLLGQFAAPWLTALLISQEWSPAKRQLTEQLVRILFPGAGLLALSAWSLGVLNSHRRFLLAYASPMFWNATIVVAVLSGGVGALPSQLVIYAAWGSVVGSLIQVLVLWPTVVRVSQGIRPIWWRGVAGVPDVLRAVVPNIIARGANQIAGFIDLRIATWLPTGAAIAITNAQILYTLPVSLFGMAISAAELPEMSRLGGTTDQIAQALRVRLSAATQRLSYYIIPSAMGFLTLGGVIAAALLEGGRFTADDSRFVWFVLAGSSIGLLAATLARLYASTFYALHDTRTPLRYALIRVLFGAALGISAVRVTHGMLGLEAPLAAAALTASAGIAGWLEFFLLRRGLRARLGTFDLPRLALGQLWGAALAAGVVGTVVRLLGTDWPPLLLAVLAVGANAVTYLAITTWCDVPEAAVLTGRLRRRLRQKR